MNQKQSTIISVISIIIIFTIIGYFIGTGKLDRFSIGCKTVTKYRTESYTETVGYKNCDYDSACRCIHKSWVGLGACDSCSCTKERQVPYTVEECWGD